MIELLQQAHRRPAAGSLLGGGGASSNGVSSTTVHCLTEPPTAPHMHSIVDEMACLHDESWLWEQEGGDRALFGELATQDVWFTSILD